MSSLVIPQPEQTMIPVQGLDQQFPVRRVYCIGRNYAAHAIEMGHDPDREPPFFFQKNPSNAVYTEVFPYPEKSSEVHYELELVVALQSGGKNIPVTEAMSHVYGYGIGFDMTRRDLQAEMKKMGRPWEIGKAFENSAPMSAITPIATSGELNAGRIALWVNSELHQDSDLNQMIWKVPEQIAYLSEYFELAAGDLILTGTPSGVGPLSKGDQLKAVIEGLGEYPLSII